MDAEPLFWRLDNILGCECLGFLRAFNNPCLVPDYRNGDFSIFLSDFEEVSDYNDPYFGNIILLEHAVNKGEMVVVRNINYSNEELFQLASIQQRQLCNYRNIHIVNLLYVDTKIQEGFFRNTFTLYLVYEYILVDLLQQLRNRMLQLNPYSEHELMLILTQCVHGLYYLENRQILHGAIRLRHLYITFQQQMKVGYRQLFDYETNYDSIRYKRKQRHIYLSPEEMEDLAHGLEMPTRPIWRSDVFSFGMCMLSLMSSTHLDSVYDYKRNIMYFERIEEAFKIARQRYSTRILSIVESMLKDINNRVTFEHLAQKLVSTSGRPIEVTMFIGDSPRDVNMPFYTFDRPERSDPASYPNNLARLVFPYVTQYTEQISRRTQEPRLFDDDLGNDLSVANYLRVPRNNLVQHDTGTIFAGEEYDDLTRQKQGRGIYKMPTGPHPNSPATTYIGGFQNDLMDGRGLLYWPSMRVRYDGQFKLGKFHGKGTEYTENPQPSFVSYQDLRMLLNWFKYEGEYVNDIKTGKGIVYFTNGWWEGNFQNNQPHGQGVWHPYATHEQPVAGIWNQGIFSSWVQQPQQNI